MNSRSIGMLAFVALLCISDVLARQNGFAIVNVNIWNGTDDGIAEDAIVLVNGGTIERIGDEQMQVPRDYAVIDAENNYLMPGMFDVHTHISSLEQARRALESGVTTVRTGSVSAYQDVGLNALVEAGHLAGPEVVAAGVFVTPNLGDTILADPRLSTLADGVHSDEALRKVVQINADRGVRVIKTRGTERAGLPETDPRQQVYTERQLRVIVDEADRHGLSVMVHAHGDEGARAAVLAGARSIEHGTYLSDETLALMQARGTWLVPTYVTMDEMNEEQYDYVLRLRGKHMVPQLERAIRAAHAMGVRIATGADNYYDAKSINRIAIEVEHFLNFGMTHFEALQTATVSAAELLHMGDRTGRLEAGFEADMILVPANPLTNIEALQDVLMVVSNGQIAMKRIPFAIQEESAGE